MAYFEAAKILKLVLEKKGSVKNACLSSKYKVK